MQKVEKTGITPKLRSLAALDAIPEAIGRCVETNRPAHAQPYGALLSKPERAPAALAAFSLLGYVAETSANLGCPLIITSNMAETLPIVYDQLQTAYIKSGHPEIEPDLRFITSQQYAAAMGVIGIFNREKIGASFLFGSFGGDVLILAESAHNVGAMLISGTQIHFQIPVMVVASDYSLIGEELFAAGAIITGDPNQLGSIVAQDITKILLIALAIGGTILHTLGFDLISFLNNLAVV